jgi:hypothetical protein
MRRLLVGKRLGEETKGRLASTGRIITKRKLKKCGMRMWTGFMWSSGNELSCSIHGGDFLAS